MTDRIEAIRALLDEFAETQPLAAMIGADDARLLLSELDAAKAELAERKAAAAIVGRKMRDLGAENRALRNVAKCARHTSRVIAGKNAEIARLRESLRRARWAHKQRRNGDINGGEAWEREHSVALSIRDGREAALAEVARQRHTIERLVWIIARVIDYGRPLYDKSVCSEWNRFFDVMCSRIWSVLTECGLTWADGIEEGRDD